jgi:hypothetical protein
MTILHTTVKMYDIMITVCWQASRDLRERTAVAVSKGYYGVGLRKDCSGYEQTVPWCWTEEGLLWL